MGGPCSKHGEIENAYTISVRNLKGRSPLQKLGMDGEKQFCRMRSGFIIPRTWAAQIICENIVQYS
jgi:hypothetical protein